MCVGSDQGGRCGDGRCGGLETGREREQLRKRVVPREGEGGEKETEEGRQAGRSLSPTQGEAGMQLPSPLRSFASPPPTQFLSLTACPPPPQDVEMSMGSLRIPTEFVQSINPFLIICFTPLISAFWRWQVGPLALGSPRAPPSGSLPVSSCLPPNPPRMQHKPPAT